mmetsp:Transcript_19736/g.57299  ORF Transcript_19736/g.57299 Transcript_19736/m.57299 type:complete len:459 (-) Transcript_19736:48-1424(-)
MARRIQQHLVNILLTLITSPRQYCTPAFSFLPTTGSRIHPLRRIELKESVSSIEDSHFAQDVLHWLDTEGVSYRRADSDLAIPRTTPGQILALKIDTGESQRVERGGERIALHLLPSPGTQLEVRSPGSNRRLTDAYQSTFGSSRTLIQLHEDVYRSKETIVKSRILARLGRLQSRCFARKTVARRIGRDLYIPFLEDHHLWGSTRAKCGYGLFDKSNDDLLAVATFSARRHVVRDGRKHRSHELIRTCSRRDGHVVGGISKLIQAFIRDHAPDDIVTVVDRDWGPGSTAWHGLGFETVHVMPPLPMAVWKGDGLRRHLVGAGIVPTAPNESLLSTGTTGFLRHRPGLPVDLLNELTLFSDFMNKTNGDMTPEGLVKASVTAQCILAHHGYFLVHDCGVERLILLVNKSSVSGTARTLALNSNPTYATAYYSDNNGVSALLRNSQQDCVDCALLTNNE